MIIRSLALCGELAVINGLQIILYICYKHFQGDYPPGYKRLLVLMSIVYIICNVQAGMVVHKRFVRPEQIFRRVIANTIWYIFVSFLILWTMHWPLLTWNFMVPFYLSIIIGVMGWRWFVRQVIKRYRTSRGNLRRAIFVGPPQNAQKLIRSMALELSTGYEFNGYFSEEEDEETSTYGEYLGKPSEVIDYLETHPEKNVDQLFCTLSTEWDDLVHDILNYSENHFIRFHSIPTNFNFTKRTMAMELMTDVPVFSLHNEPLASPGNRWLKRGFDICVSLLFLCTIFPFVFIIFGSLIKLSSPGPIFFKQKRSGLNGKEFYCYKFRSMKINQDSDKIQATKDDPRKTRVGEFMRRTNIDELPQLINVLHGDMSLVGPRPHMLKHTEEFSSRISNYMLRHFVKPGITGYAQVTGYRGEIKSPEQLEGRIERDIWYVEHWSFALDLWIIMQTILKTGEENAY